MEGGVGQLFKETFSFIFDKVRLSRNDTTCLDSRDDLGMELIESVIGTDFFDQRLKGRLEDIMRLMRLSQV